MRSVGIFPLTEKFCAFCFVTLELTEPAEDGATTYHFIRESFEFEAPYGLTDRPHKIKSRSLSGIESSEDIVYLYQEGTWADPRRPFTPNSLGWNEVGIKKERLPQAMNLGGTYSKDDSKGYSQGRTDGWKLGQEKLRSGVARTQKKDSLGF